MRGNIAFCVLIVYILLCSISIIPAGFGLNEQSEYIVVYQTQPQALQTQGLRVASQVIPSHVVLNETKENLESLKKKGIVKVYQPNYPVSTLLSESVPLINATTVWENQLSGVTMTGIGQTICIIDTGIDESHPDLTGKQLYEYDYFNNQGSVTDIDGHGTHVAGIAVANGTLKGVAPGAKFVDLKMIQNNVGSTSDLITAINFCTANSETYNISVISMSLGTTSVFSDSCDDAQPVLTNAVNAAALKNISVIAASGNNYSSVNISSPACITNVTAVGSTTKSDLISVFSDMNSLVDIVAPGSLINSTKEGGGYRVASGTSMATPHYAGAIALLKQYAQQNNTVLSNDLVFEAFNTTGEKIYLAETDDNYSRINVLAAFQYLFDPQIPTYSLHMIEDTVLTQNNSIINISLTVPQITPQYSTITNLTLNISSLGSACNGENIIPFTYNGSSWNGGCEINKTYLTTQPTSYQFVFSYTDSILNQLEFANISFITHNLSSTVYEQPCWALSSSSTQLDTISNYDSVDLTLAFELNRSCYTNTSKQISNWDEYVPALTLQYQDINLTNVTKIATLKNITDEFLFNITTAHSFLNTAFALGTNVSFLAIVENVSLFNSGFTSYANLTNQNITSFTLDTTHNITQSNLTFYAGNVTLTSITLADTTQPTIMFNQSQINLSTQTPNITLTLNTTGTSLYEINTIIEGQNRYYNSLTGASDNMSCIANMTNTQSSTCTLFNITLSDSAQTVFYVNVTDFGNNTLVANQTLVVDTTAPNITLNISNGSIIPNQNYTISFNVTDAINTAQCWYYNGSVNSTPQNCTENTTLSIQTTYDQNYSYTFYANDSFANLGQKTINFTLAQLPVVDDRTLLTQQNGTIVFSFVVTDNDNITNVTVRFNDTLYQTTHTTETLFGLTIPLVSIGTYNYSINATDSANNTLITQLLNITVISLGQNETIITNQTQSISIVNQTNETKIIVPKSNLPYVFTITKTNATESNTYLNFSYFTTLQGTTKNVSIANNITVSTVDSLGTTVFFEENTTIMYPLSSKSHFLLPRVLQTNLFTISTATLSKIIVLGSTNERINLTKPMKIVLEGEGGKNAAYSQAQGTLTKITTTCNSPTKPTNINRTATQECAISQSGDLIIWTYHLTYFGSYVEDEEENTGGGGGSGGGSSSVSPIEAAQSQSNVQKRRLYFGELVADQVKSVTTLPDSFLLSELGIKTTESRRNVDFTIEKKNQSTDQNILETYEITFTKLLPNQTTLDLTFNIFSSMAVKYDSFEVRADGITYALEKEGTTTYTATVPLTSEIVLYANPLAVTTTNSVADTRSQNQSESQNTVSKTQDESVNTTRDNVARTISKSPLLFINWTKVSLWGIAVIIAIISTLILIKYITKPRARYKIPKF